MDYDIVKKPSKKDPRKRYAKLRQELRLRVFAMQDTCGICGREVDKTLPAGNPLAPELDEIIPVSRGGDPYDLDNLQLAHRICNEKKSNIMPGDIAADKITNPTPLSRAW